MGLLFKSMVGTFFAVFFLLNYLHIMTFEEMHKNSLESVHIVIKKTNNITASVQKGLDDFIDQNLINWSNSKTRYEQRGLKFNWLTYNNIHKDPLFEGEDNRDKFNTLETMQGLSLHIASNYSVKPQLSEQIVYRTYLEAKERKIEPLLLLSIISVESTFKPQAKSWAGAIGLTQVIPKYHLEKIEKLPPQESIWSINGNIQVGADVIHEYLNRSKGNTRLALQMYNGSTHDSTHKYSNKVFNKLNKFKRVAQNYAKS